MIDTYNHLTNLTGSIDIKFKWSPRLQQKVQKKATLLHFDGRDEPVAYFSRWSDKSWDVKFLIDTVEDGDQWTDLEALVDAEGQILIWQDVFGNVLYCVVTVDPLTRDMIVSGATLGRLQEVAFTIHEVAGPASSSSAS